MSDETEREKVMKLLVDMDAFIRTCSDPRLTLKRELIARYTELMRR